jgi:HD-like signal output (HDOD) protein/nitrogen-specific signal transduction histidine kinase
MTNNTMKELKLNRLPSLPHVLVDMLQACQGNRTSFQEMSVIIGRDAAITARVISLANSSFYNRGSEINTIDRALLVLGTDTIKTIVITTSVQQFFSGFSTEHTVFLKQFWRQSLTCALIAKSIAILTSYPNPEEAYLTGLLHNIGELVLDSNYPEQYAPLITEALTETAKLEAEQQLFSFNHAEVGAWLAKEWDLSDFTADAIQFHHVSSHAVQDAHHLVKLIYLASHLSSKSDLPAETTKHDTHTFPGQPLEAIGYQLFELNVSLVNEIVLKIESEVNDVANTLGIDINTESGQSDDTDRQTQVALAQHVRNIGLLQTASSELNRANSKLELGRAFQSTLELLFGYPKSAIFWYQADANELSFIASDNKLPIKFKLEASRSLIAEAALENNIICSFENKLSKELLTHSPVVDQQVAHLVKSEGFICLPIKHKDTIFCVLVVGSNHPLKPNSNQATLLKYFADEIATTCSDTLRHIQAEENSVSGQTLTERAREIAHEANNPLNIISNYLTLLGQKLTSKLSQDTSNEINEELAIVREEVERTSKIISRLKDLEHDTIDTQKGVDINHEINNLCALYKHSLFLLSSTQCNLNLDAKLTKIPVNKNHLKQIITNLVKNSVEAMPEGGTIDITTTNKVNMNGKDFVEIVVSDNGPGINSDILKDLFSPTTSTKGDGHSGLGLSITKNLVTDAKGTISCRSNAISTSFQVLLPHEAFE